MTTFLLGLMTPIRAFRLLLSHPKIFLFSALPVFLTLALWSFGLHELFLYLSAQWNTSLAWIGSILVGAIALVSLSFISAVIGTPLNDHLALITERVAIPSEALAPEISFFSRAQMRIFYLDASKSMMALGLSLCAWAFAWVPLLNLVSFGVIALCLAFTFVSYPQSRRGMGLRQSWKQIWANFLVVFGFGIATALLSSIPWVSALFLPIHVIGGTLVFARFK